MTPFFAELFAEEKKERKKSKEVKKVSDSMFEVTGDFTLHGVTKSITVKVNPKDSANDKYLGRWKVTSPGKFSLGLVIVGLGTLLLVPAAQIAQG